jgi:D-alanine-D-alanine ligase
MTNIALIYGGPSPEHEISVLTGLQAGRILLDAGQDVTSIYWTKQGSFFKVDPRLEAQEFLKADIPTSIQLDLIIPQGFVEKKKLKSKELEVDVVLNCCHGGPGEEGVLSAMLQMCGIKVTGPRHDSSAVFMDKLATSSVCEAIGVKGIETVELNQYDRDVPFPAPWIVKPRFGGSSVGVETGIEDIETAKAIFDSGTNRAGMVIQPFLKGWIDLTISVRTYPQIEVTPISRPLNEDGKIYDYNTKYLQGGGGMDFAPCELPAQLPAEITARIEESTIKLAKGYPITGIPRLDFFWDGKDDIKLIEVNPIPGAFGLYLWKAKGYDRSEVLLDLIAEAKTQPPRPHQWTNTEDGSALRVAGKISNKLQ